MPYLINFTKEDNFLYYENNFTCSCESQHNFQLFCCCQALEDPYIAYFLNLYFSLHILKS